MPRAFSTTPPIPSPAGDWKASIIKSRPSPRSPTASAMNSFSFFVYYPFTTLGSNLSDEPLFLFFCGIILALHCGLGKESADEKKPRERQFGGVRIGNQRRDYLGDVWGVFSGCGHARPVELLWDHAANA